MKRRDAIKALGALTGAAGAAQLLSSCGSDGDDGEEGITTLVFMMMENRTYDHFLGSRSLIEGLPGDGLTAGITNPDINGNDIEIFPATNEIDLQCVIDPPHGWTASRTQFADGANTGFVIAHQMAHNLDTAIEPMSYLLREHVPATYALADEYTVCDRWYASVLGPTLPNRMYWHAATSNGAMDNDSVLNGAFEGVPSIYHRLDEAGIDWAYYYGDLPVLSFVKDLQLEGRLRRFFFDFLDDAAAGTLPPVVYIDPAFSANDDHPPHHPMLGQQLISATYQALATSPQWKNCMLVITYDEHGGFYDHVAPPKAPDDNAALGFDQLGFRVPAMVIGPYAKKSYISSVEYDHTSALKHIEEEFELSPLTMRSTAATNLMDTIDLERLAAGDPADPIELPAIEFDETSLPDSCSGQAFRYDHDIIELADRAPELFKRWDLRPELRDYVFGIGDYLDKHNLGRIKRKK